MIIGGGSNRNKNKSLKANFNVKQSTTFIHEFELYYVNIYNQEVPYDFTGSYLQFNIKSKYGTIIKKAGTISVIDNIVRLYIGADDLDFYGKYKYELVVTSSTNETSTLVEGEINIERSVVTTLQEITNNINLVFKSFYSVIANKLFDNKIFLGIKSSYEILFAQLYSKTETIKSSYIINQIEIYLQSVKLSISSNYSILEQVVTNLSKSLNISSNYSITQQIVTNLAKSLNINSSYTITLIQSIVNKYNLSFNSSYSITTEQIVGATVSIQSSYTITEK